MYVGFILIVGGRPVFLSPPLTRSHLSTPCHVRASRHSLQQLITARIAATRESVRQREMKKRRRPRAVVVGGSIAGVSCAHALTLAGWDVVILEKSRGPPTGSPTGAGVGIDRLSQQIIASWVRQPGALRNISLPISIHQVNLFLQICACNSTQQSSLPSILLFFLFFFSFQPIRLYVILPLYAHRTKQSVTGRPAKYSQEMKSSTTQHSTGQTSTAFYTTRCHRGCTSSGATCSFLSPSQMTRNPSRLSLNSSGPEKPSNSRGTC